MNVKELLINTLKEFGYPVYLQGTLSEYPDSFFTFWNTQSYDTGFFDNTETGTVWNIQLNFYSDNPALVNSIFRQIKGKLKQAGFIADGGGWDLSSDEPTHTGRGIDLIYIERGINNE